MEQCSFSEASRLSANQDVKKFPAFCGTRRFITAFTSTRHLPLSTAIIRVKVIIIIIIIIAGPRGRAV